MGTVEIGAPVPDVRVLDTDGRTHALRDLVAGQPAVLFFLRHYG
jgi:peroxiredoxin